MLSFQIASRGKDWRRKGKGNSQPPAENFFVKGEEDDSGARNIMEVGL